MPRKNELSTREGNCASPVSHRDEFPAEYSLAGCSPAEPASAPLPISFCNHGPRFASTIQRTGFCTILLCLTKGRTPLMNESENTENVQHSAQSCTPAPSNPAHPPRPRAPPQLALPVQVRPQIQALLSGEGEWNGAEDLTGSQSNQKRVSPAVAPPTRYQGQGPIASSADADSGL